MKYAVVQDMIDRFGAAELTQLTDRADPPAGTYDSDAIEKALNDAEAEIDAYLLARYALPLTTVPTMLTRLTCDIARYQLHGPALTEEVTKRYSDAVAFLKSVSRGDAVLGIDQTTGSAPTVTNAPEHFGPPRTFSRDTLRDYSD
jgi:phage gp36-like protein